MSSLRRPPHTPVGGALAADDSRLLERVEQDAVPKRRSDDWIAPLYNCSLVDGDPSDPTTGVVAMGREAASFRDWPCPLPDSKVVQRKWGAPRAECSSQ